MDSGLIQILVIAFFVIISMMDAAARKKRQEQDPHTEMGRSESAEGGGDLLAHQADAETSEGMVPDELWEEIAAIARGRTPPSARPLPPAPEPEVEPSSRYSGVFEPEETRLGLEHQHVERHDHVEWSPDDSPAYPIGPVPDEVPAARTGSSLTLSTTPLPTRPTPLAMSERADSQPGAGTGPTRRSPARGRGARRMLTLAGPESVRQAMVLSEVLSPPVALRDSEHEPPG